MSETRRGPVLFADGVAAAAAGAGLAAVTMSNEQRFTDGLANCSTTARMPGYALPAGTGAVVQMAATVAVALLGRRQRSDTDGEPWWRVLGAPLPIRGVAGMLFTGYFGVVCVSLDMGHHQSCFG